MRYHGKMNFVLAFDGTTPVYVCTLPGVVCSNAKRLKDVSVILITANSDALIKCQNSHCKMCILTCCYYRINYLILRRHIDFFQCNILQLLLGVLKHCCGLQGNKRFLQCLLEYSKKVNKLSIGFIVTRKFNLLLFLFL